MIILLVIICVFSNFSLFINCQNKPYNFEPASRHVEVNEGDNFIVEFQELGDNQTTFGRCYVEGGTFKAEWVIQAPKNSTNSTDDEDIPCYSPAISQGFRPFNCSRLCGFVYLHTDDKVPLEWTLTVYDNVTKEYIFTETVTVTFYYNMPMYLDRITAFPTSSIVNFLKPGDVKLNKCTLGFDNTTLGLDMNAVKVYNDNNIFKSRLTSLGNGKCGFKINNLASGESTQFFLYGTDEANKVYRSVSDVVVVPNKNLINRTIEAFLGDSTRIYCGSENIDSSQKYCHLYNTQGNLVTNDKYCDYNLDIVTIDDLGNWKCIVGYDYTMGALELSTVLVEKKRENVVTFTEETTDYLIIGCKFNNFNEKFSYCKFTRPDGEVFSITEGMATSEYSSFSGDIANYKCSLEILKPLRDVDKGNWKCESTISSKVVGGGFVTVETSKNFPYDKYMQKNVHLGHSFTINCMVPYSSDNCYIVAPNGTQYKPDDSLQSTAGLCSFTVGVSTLTDNGTWSCSIAQKNGIPDDIIQTDISIIELKVLYANVEASVGDQVELICNTNGIPLYYCRFVAPSGDAYSLRKDDTSFNKITYKGLGLEYGDCGIQISQVTKSEGGQWSCHIGVGRYSSGSQLDLVRKIDVVVNSPSNISMAGSVGIAVGVLAAAIIMGGFVFYRGLGRKRIRGGIQEPVQFTGRMSDGSDSSGEIVTLAVPQNTYNT